MDTNFARAALVPRNSAVAAAARFELAPSGTQMEGEACRVCGCTDDDCRGCIERTGAPCSWCAPLELEALGVGMAADPLCSACANLLDQLIRRRRAIAVALGSAWREMVA